MENCTIYSHYLDFDKVIELANTHLPKASIEVSKLNELERSLVATIKGGLFSKAKTLTINYRQRLNPSYQLETIDCELTNNLAGMANFINSLPAKNEAVQNKLIYKALAANCEMPFMAEPVMAPEFEALLQEIITGLDAFAFVQPGKFFNRSGSQYFADKKLRVIIDSEGNCEIDDLEVNISTEFFDPPASDYTAEQLERKAASEAFLTGEGVKINPHLPCVASEDSVVIRDKKEMVGRAYALLVVAAKGEGIEQEYLDKTVQEKGITEFSPNEKTLFESTNLSNQDMATASWRYESLNAILWALGFISELKYPSEECDVANLVSLIFKPTREEFESLAQPKSKQEILDELDKTYRMHWACVNARVKGEPISGNLNTGVVYERHYLLNWLTNHHNEDWDDVQTAT